MPKDITKPLSIGVAKPVDAIKASLKRKVVLPDVYYGQMQGIEHAQAFSIAGIAKLDQLQQALDSLTRALHEGMSFDQWKTQALKADDVLALPRHRLDNIFRTNIQVSYARGRCIHIEAHKAARPFLLYSAINDARVRPHHLAMNGHVAEVGDQVWKRWTPPCGYRCRCTVISLTKAQAEKRRQKDAQRLANDPDAAQARQAAIQGGPDEGWGYSPCEDQGKAIAALVDAKKPKMHPSLGAHLDTIEQEAQQAFDVEDFGKWSQVGQRKGSNPGGLYEDPSGQQWYVKLYGDPNQAKSEIAAQAIYRLAGIEAPSLKLMHHQGKTYLASKWMEGTQTKTAAQLAKSHPEELARIYAVSAMVKNWDVIGLSLDNLAVTKAGRLVVIDAGGSFKYRAQGKPKAFMAGPVDELEVMADPNRTAGKVFGLLKPGQRATGIRQLGYITKAQLTDTFIEAGFQQAEAKALLDATWARRKWMLETVRNLGRKPRTSSPAMTTARARAIIEGAPLYEISSNGGLANLQRIHGWSDNDAPFKAAIYAYSGADYERINDALRAGGKQMWEEVAQVINAALEAMPKASGTVRRGIRSWIDQAWLDKATQANTEGKALEFIGFSSAGKGAGWKKRINAVIESKGLQGVDIDAAKLTKHRGEGGGEVLFPHLSRFRVDKIVNEPNGNVTLHLVEDEKAFKLEAIRLSA